MADRHGPPLGARLFRFAGLLLVLFSAAALWITVRYGEQSARRDARERLVAAAAFEAAAKQRQYRELALYAEILASRPGFKDRLAAAIAENDRARLIALLEERRPELGYELAIVVDPAGVLAARSDAPELSGVDLAARPLVRQVREKFEAAGVWAEEDGLFETVAVPMAVDDGVIGFLVLGYRISDSRALEVQRSSGAEVIYVAGRRAAASSLPAGGSARALAVLQERGELLARAERPGEEPALEELRLDGGRWLVRIQRLQDAAKAPAGVLVALSSLDRELAGYRQIRNLLLASGLGGLLVAWLLSALLARRLMRSLAAPASPLAEAAADGRGAGAEPSAGPDASAPSVPAEDARQEDRPELGADGAETPAARDVVLLGAELRGLRRPRPGQPAAAVIERLAAVLGEIGGRVEACGGRIERSAGAVALATFEGERRLENALAAAADLLTASETGDPEAPALALASGSLIAGDLPLAGTTGRALVGLPLDQVEALLREASEGELLVSPAVRDELAPTLEKVGVELARQRGVLSRQPLFQLTAEQAALYLGSAEAEDGWASTSDDARRADRSGTEGEESGDAADGENAADERHELPADTDASAAGDGSEPSEGEDEESVERQGPQGTSETASAGDAQDAAEREEGADSGDRESS